MTFEEFTKKYGTDGPKIIMFKATHWESTDQEFKEGFFRFAADLESALNDQASRTEREAIANQPQVAS
jgi:hypothetical protein